jgi:hypothetical protein
MALTRPKYSNIVDTDYKASCRIVTTTNITLSGSAPSTYDGVTLAAGDRVLVAGQSTGSQNGLYTVLTLGSGSNGTWTRAFDANDGTRLSAGMQTTIGEGTYGGKPFRLITPDPITVGVTSLSFVEGSGVPGGSNKQLQYNNNNALGGASALEYILANTTLISTGNVISSANLISTKFRAGELIWNANGSPILSDVPDPSVYLGQKTITTATTLIDTVPIAGNVGFRWTVTAKDTINSRFRYGILDSVNDGTTVYYNEYSKIFSDPAYPVGTFTSNITSGNINLWGVGDSASVQVTFQRLSLGSLTVEGYAKQKMAIGPRGDITATAGVITTTNLAIATSSSTGALLVSGGAGIAGNIYSGENIVATGNITALGQITATGNLTVQGNLIVQGDVTTINAATLDIEDLNITVAKGAASAAAANGAGLTVDGASATITYTSGTNRWNMNKDLSVNTTYLTDLPRWSANSNPVRTGISYTASATPPAAPFNGDQWYDTTDDTLYEWINDGATSYWIDIQTTAITAAAPSVLLTYAGGSIIPTSNLAYTLGNSSYRFGNVWTGNLTTTNMYIGSGVPSASNTTGALVINGGAGITGNINLVYNPVTAIGSAIQLTGKDTQGGTGYFDFLKATNTTSGATNPNKTFRLSSIGGIELINSAYTTTILSLSDAGVMNVSGSYQVAGKKAVNGPAFSAYADSTLQTITSGSQQKVLFQTEEFDTDGCFASSRFTPTVEGYYQLNAEVRLDGSSGTGEIMIVLYKNTSEHKRGTNQSGTSIATNFFAMQVSSVVYANGTTDYFEIKVQQTSGGSMTVTAVNNSAITWFNGAMVRGA